MNNFKYLVLEALMSGQQALDIFGIKPGQSPDIKKLYIELSKKNHPDVGGSVEKMQDINAAYQVLKNMKFVDPYAKEEKEKKVKQKVLIVDKELKEVFDPKKYMDYFKKFFSGNLEYTFKENQNTVYGSVQHTYEFFTSDRETLFHVQIYASLWAVNFSASLGGTEEGLSFEYTTDNFILHNNRKQKLKQRTWDVKKNSRVIVKPEVLFPVKTMKDIFEGKKNRSFKPRDFKLALSKKLSASVSKDQAYIDIGDNLRLIFNRVVMMRLPTWSLIGVFKGYKRVGMPRYVSMLEDETTLSLIEEWVKKTRKMNDVDKIVQYLNKELEQYYQSNLK